MKIELIGKKVAELSLQPIEGESSAKKAMTAKVTLNNELYSNVKDAKLFRVRYHVQVTIETRLQIDLTYDFDFKSDADFSEEVAKTLEMRTLVPSMAYPYIKSYSEQLISMSGLGNFNLPYFNFFSEPLEPNE